MEAVVRKLAQILEVPLYRRLAAGIAAVYLLLFLFALQDVTLRGGGLGFTTADPDRMLERTGPFTFEAVARLTLPGATVLIAPGNILIGTVLSLLVGLALVVTFVAFRQPSACSFDRSTDVLASLPGSWRAVPAAPRRWS